MKYAVMSDVHANPKALETVLADAKRHGCRKFVLLGDLTGYGYDVRTTIRLVRDNFDTVLMGNHDSACVGLEPWLDVALNRNYRVDVLQRDELDEADRMWLKTRPYDASEGDAFFVHGDSTEPQAWKYVMEPEMVVINLFTCPKRIMFCGHTHHAAVWELVMGSRGAPAGRGGLKCKCCPRFLRFLAKPALVRPDSRSFSVAGPNHFIVNVGSVGYPRNDLCATYAIYDSSAARVTIRRIPVNLRAYAEDLSRAGVSIPIWLRDALLTA